MTKHEIYKKYDEVFNNTKLNRVKREIKNVNQRSINSEEVYKKRVKFFAGYCKEFIDKDVVNIDDTLRITKENGIEKFETWRHKWHPISLDYFINKSVEKSVPYLSEEGKQVFEKIKTLDASLSQKRVMVNVGKLKSYHRKYFYLPSYSKHRSSYPINIILKDKYGRIGISIPAFHRYPIISEWDYCSDSESLKRNMLLVEFYDDIKKHFFPILREHEKRMKWIENNNEKVIQELAKYEMLIKI